MIKKAIFGFWVLLIALGAVGGVKYIFDHTPVAVATCCGTGPNVFFDPLYTADGNQAFPSYSFDTASELGFHRTSGSTINFTGSSTSRVGINKASPLHRLHGATHLGSMLKLESTAASGYQAMMTLYRNNPSYTSPNDKLEISFNANGVGTTESEPDETISITAQVPNTPLGSTPKTTSGGRLIFLTSEDGNLGTGDNEWQIELDGHLWPSVSNENDLGGASNKMRNASVGTETRGNKLILTATALASLGAGYTVTNGMVYYCSDCTKATPCTGSGNGAWAKRLNGAWDCD